MDKKIKKCKRKDVILPGDGFLNKREKFLRFMKCVDKWHGLPEELQRDIIKHGINGKKPGFSEFLRTCQCKHKRMEEITARKDC